SDLPSRPFDRARRVVVGCAGGRFACQVRARARSRGHLADSTRTADRAAAGAFDGIHNRSDTVAEYTLPPLPYDFGALEPHIDAKTMEIHHDKHHAAYVNNLNAALKDHPDHQGKTIEALIANLNALPEGIRTAVRNNGGGHANHSLFWQIM